MAQSYLIFDFGTNEEAAQHARHRIEGWKQAFRLDKKMQLKFERRGPETAEGGEKAAKKEKAEKGEADEKEHVRLIVRLDFSDHERLSHHRWVERLPIEEPFKDASPKIIRAGESEFDRTVELFDSLP
jgi:hypothetical protein